MVVAMMKSLYQVITDKEKRKSFKNTARLLTFKKIWLFIILTFTGVSLHSQKKDSEQYSLKLSFSRKASRIAGKFATVKIPVFLRKPLFTMYAKFYNVILDEIVNDIESFESFSKFFTRTIRPRPVDAQPLSIASPADSRVLTFSEVKGDEVLIVKGIEYKLGEFLTGVNTCKINEESLKAMKRNPENKLYQIILYLAPGDYHRFHAPVDCVVKTRNHIIGKLLPVKEKFVKTHTNVYEKNERVSLFGDWAKGLFCQIFVGALNVGTIELNFDSDLHTNRKLKMPFTNTDVKVYAEENEEGNQAEELAGLNNSGAKGIQIKKGEETGKFNLGSTIVLVFEASADFEWNVEPGQAVKYGQCIGVSK